MLYIFFVMKLTTFTVLFTVTLMVSGTVFGSVSFQEVEAVKAKGVGTQKYGSSTGVCGDRLCSEIPGGREAWEQSQAGITPVIPDYGLEAKNLTPEMDYNIKPGTQKMGFCNCSEDGTCTCGAGQDVIAQDQLCMVNVNAVQMVVIVQDLVCKEHVLLVEDMMASAE
jgi:hypothetical protein